MTTFNKFVIEGRLIGLNDYTETTRTNKYRSNAKKAEQQHIVEMYIKQAKLQKVNKQVELYINWYEKDNRRDVDNITFASKFICDALVNQKILIDDRRKYVKNIHHLVFTDNLHPRIEICMEYTD